MDERVFIRFGADRVAAPDSARVTRFYTISMVNRRLRA
jgi:hypothetical protein